MGRDGPPGPSCTVGVRNIMSSLCFSDMEFDLKRLPRNGMLESPGTRASPLSSVFVYMLPITTVLLSFTTSSVLAARKRFGG